MMRSAWIAFALPVVLLGGPMRLRVEPSERTLRGEGATQQLLVLQTLADGTEKDVTGQSRIQVSAPGVAAVEATGKLRAKSDGDVVVSASFEGLEGKATFHVQDASVSREFEFARGIGSILTRQGCNSPACHGGVKGRGGFKLSPGALYPKDDYEWIVKGGAYQVLTAEVKGERIPRINVKDPGKSLVLLKATGSVAHGGGRRFPVDSADYRTILQWVSGGAPFGPEPKSGSQVVRLEITPKTVVLEREGQHRLLATAHFADGHTEDFTDQALCASNDREVATVSSCVVKAGRLGETSVLVRAAGMASSATVGVIGAKAAESRMPVPANFVDEFVYDKLRRFRIPPSERSSDDEFLRRICLDLAGTLPPPDRTREFLANKDPKKREKLIASLMASPEFVDYWTYRFDDLFRVGVFPNGINPKWSEMYADWLRTSLATNKPYDQMARERIAAQGYDGPTRHYLPYDVIGPAGETMAEEVRVFFGRRLDCAQCHNHPYEAWTQDQFWGMAAFFGRVFKMGDTGAEYVVFDHPASEPMGNGDVNGSIKLLHPRTKAELKPVLLDGTAAKVSDRVNPRKELATWMTSHPYFAEAAANRIWGHLLGRGIVDPVDDFRSTNPATHPELLQRLATEFRAHNYDLRYLIRTIVQSNTYQVSGRTSAANREDRTNYSHTVPRPLDAEILLDAVSQVSGVPEIFTTGITDAAKGQAPAGTRAVTLRQPDLYYSRFLDVFGRPNRLTLPERSGKANLPEALHMVAGPAYQEKVSAPGGRLQTLLAARRSNEQIVDEFYVAAYSRFPDPGEREAIVKAVAASPDRNEALRDFVWAVLCSREFTENH